MYNTRLPEKDLPFRKLSAHDVTTALGDLRAAFDFGLRMRILNAKDGDTLRVISPVLKPWQHDFWQWFSSTLNVRLDWVYEEGELPAYPFPTVPSALFTSATETTQGGVESTVGAEMMYSGQLVNLDEDYYDRSGVGMVEGFIAILGPALGYAVTFIGDERYSGPEDRENTGESFSDRFAIEQTESWWRQWNNYLSGSNSVMSLVGVWTKPELIQKVHDLGKMPTTTSCFTPPEDESLWCGTCWKCASIKLVLDNKGLPSDFIPSTTPEYLNAIAQEYVDFENGIDPFRSTGMLAGVDLTTKTGLKLMADSQPYFSLIRNGSTIDLSGTPLFSRRAPEGFDIDIHQHPELGNIMFLDGEAQISTKDFEAYHRAMLNFVKPGSSILVIGDGDGGFTNRPEYKITQVEMSDHVRESATVAYGINWDNTDTYSLFRGTLAEYLSEASPSAKFDAIFLAITDEFNADGDNFADVLNLWNNFLVGGGVLVSQVGCTLDPNYDVYKDNHDKLQEDMRNSNTLRRSVDVFPYIEVFHSPHNFCALTKV